MHTNHDAYTSNVLQYTTKYEQEKHPFTSHHYTMILCMPPQLIKIMMWQYRINIKDHIDGQGFLIFIQDDVVDNMTSSCPTTWKYVWLI